MAGLQAGEEVFMPGRGGAGQGQGKGENVGTFPFDVQFFEMFY